MNMFIYDEHGNLTIRKPNGEIYNLGSINNESIYTIFFIEMEGF